MDYSINDVGEIAYLFKKKNPQENLGGYFYNCRIIKSFLKQDIRKQSHKENICKSDKSKLKSSIWQIHSYHLKKKKEVESKENNPKGKCLQYNGLGLLR